MLISGGSEWLSSSDRGGMSVEWNNNSEVEYIPYSIREIFEEDLDRSSKDADFDWESWWIAVSTGLFSSL